MYLLNARHIASYHAAVPAAYSDSTSSSYMCTVSYLYIVFNRLPFSHTSSNADEFEIHVSTRLFSISIGEISVDITTLNTNCRPSFSFFFLKQYPFKQCKLIHCLIDQFSVYKLTAHYDTTKLEHNSSADTSLTPVSLYYSKVVRFTGRTPDQITSFWNLHVQILSITC